MDENARRDELQANLDEVEERITAACAAAGRERSDVQLIVVTKTWPATDVRLLAELGVRDVGESRDQEAGPKHDAVGLPDLRWHFIGQLQRNKARSVAGYCDVVHSVDRAALAQTLAAARDAAHPLEVLVQVCLDQAPGRGGVMPDEALALADQIALIPALRLGGVMAVAPLDGDPGEAFGRLRLVAERITAAHPGATAISAGMSGDLEEAIGNGATHVRVGTAVLGHRPPVV